MSKKNEKIVFCQHCNEPVLQSMITTNGLCRECDRSQAHYHHQYNNWLDQFLCDMQPKTAQP
jgi:hypothetical protein